MNKIVKILVNGNKPSHILALERLTVTCLGKAFSLSA